MSILKIDLQPNGKMTLTLGIYSTEINTNKPTDTAMLLPWTASITDGLTVEYNRVGAVAEPKGNPKVWNAAGADTNANADNVKRPKPKDNQ